MDEYTTQNQIQDILHIVPLVTAVLEENTELSNFLLDEVLEDQAVLGKYYAGFLGLIRFLLADSAIHYDMTPLELLRSWAEQLNEYSFEVVDE